MVQRTHAVLRLPELALPVELYATDAAVAALEVVLPTIAGSTRADALVRLAWYQRQRNSERALELAAEAEGCLDRAVDPQARAQLQGRLLLVLAETSALFAPTDACDALVSDAKALFTAIEDCRGEGDAALLEAIVAQARGDMDRVIQACTSAADCYRHARDPSRERIAGAWLLFYTAFRDPAGVVAELSRCGPLPPGPALESLLAAAEGVVTSHRGDIAGATACYVRAAERARQAGMVRHAIVSAMNAAGWMQDLGDYDGASALIDEALILARAANWPVTIGLCVMRLGELFRLFGQYERSRDALAEALACFQAIPGGANKGAALAAYGETHLALGQPRDALRALRTAVRLFRQDGHIEGLIVALTGTARAFSLLGRAREALSSIEAAREAAQASGDTSQAIGILIAMSEIYYRHDIAAPEPSTAPTARIQFLEAAFALGSATAGWIAPISLLTDLAGAWEEAGDYTQAFAYLRFALAAEQQQSHRRAAARVITLESRHEAQRSRLEAERQRELAINAAAHAVALERDVRLRTAELGRIRRESRKSASRIRALWRITASEGVNDRDYLETIVSAGAKAIRPWRPFAGYVSELKDSTLTIVASASTATKLTLGPDGTSAALAGSFEELLLERNATTFANQDELHLAAGHPLSKIRWQEAIGTPIRVGVKRYFLVLATPANLSRRDPFAEDDSAFVDVLASFFAHRFAQEQQLERIRFQIEHDALTGLRNRVELRKEVRQAIAEGSPFALCFLDIDDFSDINETEGHMIGDELLVEVAASLAAVKGRHVVARMGGDVFAVLLHGVADSAAFARQIAPYARLFDQPFGTGDRDGARKLSLTCSIGGALFPANSENVDELMQRADASVVAAKRRGGSSIVAFETLTPDGMPRVVPRRAEFAGALENDELFLAYQPTFELRTRRIVGAEALVRWRHPVHGELQPATFLPMLDRLALLNGLSRWLLARVARDLSGSLGLPADFRCYINLAPQQLDDIAFVSEARERLAQYPHLAEHVGIEITETAAMHDVEQSAKVIELIRELGMKVAIDDFGTGYSTLSYLKQLPVDVIKIDRSFVTGLPDDKRDATLCQTLLRIAREFGITTLAEGIETKEQLLWLRRHDCALGQGFLISKPIPFAEFEALLQRQTRQVQYAS